MQTIVVGSTIIEHVSISKDGANVRCELIVAGRDGLRCTIRGEGPSIENAVIEAVGMICKQPMQVRSCRVHPPASSTLFRVFMEVDGKGDDAQGDDAQGDDARSGTGYGASHELPCAIVMAAMRAANQGGFLKKPYRAPHQKAIRTLAENFIEEWQQRTEDRATMVGQPDRLHDSGLPIPLPELESLVIDYFNRVASAAVLTVTNANDERSPLQFFDTSSWLYDASGRRRGYNTDTDLWFAWYPGLEEEERIIEDVMNSMPASPASSIPWIVRLFENPESWVRFRGAQDLEDHDVLHILLGRGLQDQDEAFVLGFAMGTAKRINLIQKWIFKFALAHWYPEPFRVPVFLQPAFDLGLRCGKATGIKNLYKRSLKQFKRMSIREARSQLAIDVEIIKQFLKLEKEQIPFTMASLRLP